MTDPPAKKQRTTEVEIVMFVDPHEFYAKKVGIDDNRIRPALLQQLETYNSKFANQRDLLYDISDQPKDCQKKAANV